MIQSNKENSKLLSTVCTHTGISLELKTTLHNNNRHCMNNVTLKSPVLCLNISRSMGPDRDRAPIEVGSSKL